MEQQQQQDYQSPHRVGRDHEHRGRKGHHRHLRVRRGHRERRCGGGVHHVNVRGHKHGGRHGHGHGPGRLHGHRHGHGYNGHGFMLAIDQIELWGQIMIVAHAGGACEQPQPESSGREIVPYRRHRHGYGHGHGQHPYQVAEGAVPNELSGAIVYMSLEDEPTE